MSPCGYSENLKLPSPTQQASSFRLTSRPLDSPDLKLKRKSIIHNKINELFDN
jgi:hypothetical protein